MLDFIHFVLPAKDHGVLVDLFEVEMDAVNQFLLAGDADTAQHAARHFAEHGFNSLLSKLGFEQECGGV
jgi:hypothetical protein